MTLFDMLGRADPTPWLAASDEPPARWIALAALGEPATDPDATERARHESVDSEQVRSLVALLPDWEQDAGVSGHDRPLLATNLLDLLHSMGVRGGDEPRVEALLDRMLEHTDTDGRFAMYGRERGGDTPSWGTLLCDTHAIADMMLAFGRGDDPRVRRALAAAEGDLADTAQGLAWPCRPRPETGWHGPGRARDCCPQVTLEALRAFSRLPASDRPARLAEAASTALAVWRDRGGHKPYLFGHGRQFKQVKWPPTWYGAYEVVDALGGLPEAWGPDEPEARRSLAEIAACLLAYNVSPDGTVTPLSTFKGFETHSFGQKKRPSPFATALLWAALARLEPLAEEIAAIDVLALGSSKGGSGVPQPPKVAAG